MVIMRLLIQLQMTQKSISKSDIAIVSYENGCIETKMRVRHIFMAHPFGLPATGRILKKISFPYLLYYIFFLRQRIAILIGYLFDYECIMGMAILCSSVLSAIYCHKNSEIQVFQRDFGVKTKRALSKNPFFRFNAWLFHLFFCNLTDDIEEITSRRSI